MKLGTKGRYAVMALVDLACHGGEKPLVTSDIALRQGISVAYLEQLFAKLRRSGLIKSVRGQAGGYLLTRDPHEITISDVFEAVDEPLKTTACDPHSHEGCLQSKSKCLTHNLWTGLSDVMVAYLQNITLQDVCERNLPQAKAVA